MQSYYLEPYQYKKNLIQEAWDLIKKSKNYQKARELLELGWDEYDKDWILAYGLCLKQLGEYQAALTIYLRLNDWPNNKLALRNIVFCWQKIGQFDVAEILDSIENGGKRKQQLLDLVDRLKDVRAFELAEKICKAVPNWKNDKKVLLNLSRCYEGMGDLNSAEIIYKMVSNWDKDEEVLFNLALCYRHMGKFDLAVETYKSIPRWNENKKILVPLAFCYEEMGTFELAKNTLESIQDKDKTVLNSLGICLEKMGRFTHAEKIYQSVPNWKEVQQVLLNLARCYEGMGLFEKSKKTYESIPNWDANKQVLLCVARLYEKWGKFDLAIQTHQSIVGWKTDKQVLLSLGRCYQNQGEFNLAEQTFKSIKDYNKNKQALLGLAMLYDMFGFNEKAMQFYEQILDLFPYAQDGYIAFGWFLTKKDPKQLNLFLTNCLEIWPHSCELHLLQAECEPILRNNDPFALVNKIIERFPYSTKAYLTLIKKYLSQGKIQEAKGWERFCREHFEGNYLFFNKIQEAMKAANLMQMLKQSSSFEDYDIQQQFVSTEPLKELFNHFAELPEFYLVGSSLLALLDTKELGNRDVDLMFTKDCSDKLEKLGQRKNRHLPFLYSGKIEGKKVDCIVPHLDQSNYLFFQGDFTITTIFCEAKSGKLYFPPYGSNDVKYKILRTMKDPVQSFGEDPIRLLRAIKYMVSGYKPAENVVLALNNWIPFKGINYSHLHAVARKHWQSFDEKEKICYLDYLAKYNLLGPLFALDNREPDLPKSFEKRIEFSIQNNPSIQPTGTVQNKLNVPTYASVLKTPATPKGTQSHPVQNSNNTVTSLPSAANVLKHQGLFPLSKPSELVTPAVKQDIAFNKK